MGTNSVLNQLARNQQREEYFAQLAASNRELRHSVKPRLTRFIRQFPTEKQSAFLLLNHLRDGFYGGAGGGGKSSALLMAGLQYVDVPDYSGIILRRTFRDLSQPGAILSRAHQWLDGTGARWLPKRSMYKFPSGATLSFGYLAHDTDTGQYDSAEFQFVGLDEACQFSEYQFRFMFARLRRLQGSVVPVRFRSASNPGGLLHNFLKTRYILHRKEGRYFIPALMTDNPHLDVADYRLSLAELDPVMRLQRELGDWDVNYEGTLFKRSWFPAPLSIPPANLVQVCRFWDFAATLDGGDYTVGGKVGKTEDKKWVLLDIVRGQWGPGEVEKIVLSTAKIDQEAHKDIGCMVRVEQEPGSAGKAVAVRYCKLLAGHDVKALPATGKKSTRWRPFAAQCEASNVNIVSAPWNSDFIDEICAVPQSKHDDQADSVSGAFNAIVSEPAWQFGISRLSRTRPT